MWRKIQRFGPKYSDLPSMIANVNVLLRALTVNIDSTDSTPISSACYLVTGISFVCYYFGYHFSLLWFVCWREQIFSLVALIVFFSLSVSSNIAVVKLWYIIMYRSNVQCLVDQCKSSNALTESDARFSSNMAVLLRTVKIRGIFFFTCVNTISVLHLSIPAFMPGRHLPEDLLVFYGLEPAFETPNFEISYAIMFISVNFICYITSTISVFIIIIIGYTEAQMTSLSKELLSVWDDSVEDVMEFNVDFMCAFSNVYLTFDVHTMKKINTRVRWRLIKIVKNHTKIITLLENINDFFNIPNAIAFACLRVSLIAELLGGLEYTYLQIPFTFLQVALDCFVGQKVMDASVAFETAVYDCKWENFDGNNMKMVLLMLQNSQKTLTLSAGSMAVMSFSCLMSIVKTVYSSYATLRSAL